MKWAILFCLIILEIKMSLVTKSIHVKMKKKLSNDP